MCQLIQVLKLISLKIGHSRVYNINSNFWKSEKNLDLASMEEAVRRESYIRFGNKQHVD